MYALAILLNVCINVYVFIGTNMKTEEDYYIPSNKNKYILKSDIPIIWRVISVIWREISVLPAIHNDPHVVMCVVHLHERMSGSCICYTLCYTRCYTLPWQLFGSNITQVRFTVMHFL